MSALSHVSDPGMKDGIPVAQEVQSRPPLSRVMLLGAARLCTIALLVGLLGNQLLDFRASPGDSAWHFELAGWLELAGLGEGMFVAVLFALLVAGAIGRKLWYLPRHATEEACSTPMVQTKVGKHGTAGLRESRTPEQLAVEEAAARPWLGAWTLVKYAAALSLIVFVPGLAIFLGAAYVAWLIVLKVRSSRRRAIWVRAGQRRGVGMVVSLSMEPASNEPVIRTDGTLAWVEKKTLPLFLAPVRLLLGILNVSAGLLGRIPGLVVKWPFLERFVLRWLILPAHSALVALRLMRQAGNPVFAIMADVLLSVALWSLALLFALGLGYTTARASAYSQSSPTVARLLLSRLDPAERPAAATTALVKAAETKNLDSIHAIYAAGSVDGLFHLKGYQDTRRQQGNCRDALPAAPAGIRVALDEKIESQTLVREARCANSPDHLPLGIFLDAFKRQAGARLDAQAAIDSGNPDLLAFALAGGADREAADWQGRTPLLTVLDLLAAAEQRHHRFAAVDERKRAEATSGDIERYRRMAELLLSQGANPAARDRGRRSAAFIALQSPLPPGMLEPLLAGISATETTALGATLLHAAAASGSVELVRRLAAKDVPIQARTVDGRTAMHFARGAEMVWHLLDLGLAADAPDARGRTPLHHAVLRGDILAARALGGLSADRYARDIFGRAAFDYAPARPKADKPAGDEKKAPAKPEWQQWRELAGEFPGEKTGLLRDWR